MKLGQLIAFIFNSNFPLSTTRRMYLWFDTDDYAKAPRYAKILNVIILFFVPFLWFVMFARLMLDFKDLPISRTAEGISLAMGGTLTSSSIIRFNLNRDLLTDIIREIDHKYRFTVPQDTVRGKKWWKEARALYCLEFYIVSVWIFSGFAVGVPWAISTVITGKLYCDTIIPLSTESYSWQWWIQNIYQSWDNIFSGAICSMKEFTWMSLFYHIGILYKVQADNIMQICKDPNFDPEVECKLLVDAIREMASLYE